MALGYNISLNRLSIPKLKLNGFLEWVRPKTHKELKSFLCSLSYYRSMVKNFSHEVSDLLELANESNLKKGGKITHKPFHWEDIHERSFIRIKKLLLESSSLMIPNYEKTFYCTSDASSKGIGFQVWQYDDNNQRVLISCFSRVLSRYERGYSPHKLETLACVSGILSYDIMLRGAKIVLETDAKAVTFCRLAKSTSDILLRFLNILSQYEISLVHIPGKSNSSDGLSRNYHDPYDEIEYMTCAEAEFITNLITIPKSFKLSPDEFKEFLNATPLPSLIKKYTKKKRANPRTIPLKQTLPLERTKKKAKPVSVMKPTQKYLEFMKRKESSNSNAYTNMTYYGEGNTREQDQESHCMSTTMTEIVINSNIIQEGQIGLEDMIKLQEIDLEISKKQDIHTEKGIKCVGSEDNLKILLPESLAKTLIYNWHYSPKYCHMSKNQIKGKLTQNFHLINADQIIDSIVKDCQICCLAITPRRAKHIFYRETITQPARSKYFIDLFSGVPQSEAYKFVGIAVEQLSSYVIALPLKNKGEHQIKILLLSIITAHGIPNFIVVDHETSIMNSKMIENFLEMYDIKKITIALNASWNNAAERRISQTKENLRKLVMQTGENWVNMLGHAVASINTTVMSFEPEKLSPEIILFGKTKTNIDDPIVFSENMEDLEVYTNNLTNRVNKLQDSIIKMKDQKAKQNQRYMNKRTRERKFAVNEIIVYRNLRIEGNRAVKQKLCGPCIILKLDKCSALVQNLLTEQVSKQHYTYMYKFKAANINNLPHGWDKKLLEELNMIPIQRAKRIYPTEIEQTNIETNDEDDETETEKALLSHADEVPDTIIQAYPMNDDTGDENYGIETEELAPAKTIQASSGTMQKPSQEIKKRLKH